MANNELAKRDENALVIPGLEKMDMEDIVIPTLYPDGKMGYFRDSLDEKAKKEEVTGVLLTYVKGWKLREGDPPKTTCRSFNGIQGTFGIACDGCPKRQKTEGSRDYCKRVYDFMFIPDGQEMPAIISITAVTSIGNVKKYLTLFSKKLQKPLYSSKTKVFLEQSKNAKGQTYFVVNFERLGDVPIKEQAKYQQLMELYRQRSSDEEIKDDFDFTEK